MKTVLGIVMDRDGMAHKRDLWARNKHWAFEARHKLWATPSSEVRAVQSSFIGVDVEHSHEWIGRVEHMERGPDEKLWAVASISDAFDPPPGLQLFWSPGLTFNKDDGGDVEITSLGIVQHPAQTGIGPLQFLDGGVEYRGATKRWTSSQLDGYRRDLCERACEVHVFRKQGEPLIVRDAPGLGAVGSSSSLRYDHAPPGRLEYRSASTLDVHGRTVEVLAMPAEQEALVGYQGRMVKEVISRGAFAGNEKRAHRIRVNRDHDLTRTVGKVTTLDPYHEAGLIAEVKIARTELGDETLALIEDDVLDVSAGFLPLPDGEVWETRNRRRIVKAYLGHLALTPDPAYESARVLAVRGATRRPY